MIIGSSPALRNALELATRAARSDFSCLLLGETGTGKELFAREIHARSARARGPFVVVECGAIPENLVESALFGHLRGAFTGAVADHEGFFESADSGTIFLDEIGEMPLDLQPKLLRVLQEGDLLRLGDRRRRKVDVRVVAATNRDLRSEARLGMFREDLYYRLNEVTISVPPLRSRPEDLLALAEHFVSATSKRLQRPPPRLVAGAEDALRQHSFPGNVRELKHLIGRLVLLADSDAITPADIRGQLPDPVKEEEAAERLRRQRLLRGDTNGPGVAAPTTRGAGTSGRMKAREDYERALREAAGNRLLVVRPLDSARHAGMREVDWPAYATRFVGTLWCLEQLQGAGPVANRKLAREAAAKVAGWLVKAETQDGSAAAILREWARRPETRVHPSCAADAADDVDLPEFRKRFAEELGWFTPWMNREPGIPAQTAPPLPTTGIHVFRGVPSPERSRAFDDLLARARAEGRLCIDITGAGGLEDLRTAIAECAGSALESGAVPPAVVQAERPLFVANGFAIAGDDQRALEVLSFLLRQKSRIPAVILCTVDPLHFRPPLPSQHWIRSTETDLSDQDSIVSANALLVADLMPCCVALLKAREAGAHDPLGAEYCEAELARVRMTIPTRLGDSWKTALTTFLVEDARRAPPDAKSAEGVDGV